MDYTISPNVTAIGSGDTAPASGTKGEFTDGNPATNTAATVLPGYQMNALIEEIINAITSAGLTPSNTNNSQLAAAIAAIPHGRLLNVQRLTATGTYTKTAGANSAIVAGIGGGGGAGGSPNTASGSYAVGSAGASGSFGLALFTSIPSTVAVTIGAAGAGGTSGGGAGGAGGPTSFGSMMECPGGGGGVGAVEGSPNNTTPTDGAPGGAVTLSGGTLIQSDSGRPPASFSFILGGMFSVAGHPAETPLSPYGKGGLGVALGPSLGGAAGGSGTAGLIIVYEFS